MALSALPGPETRPTEKGDSMSEQKIGGRTREEWERVFCEVAISGDGDALLDAAFSAEARVKQLEAELDKMRAAHPEASCYWPGKAEDRYKAGLAEGSARVQRLEEALLKLTESVEETPDFPFEDDPNGPGDFRCPMCFESVRSTKWVNLSPVPSRPLLHATDCPKALVTSARAALAAPDTAGGER